MIIFATVAAVFIVRSKVGFSFGGSQNVGEMDYPITVNPDSIASLDDLTEGALAQPLGTRIAKVTGQLSLLSVDDSILEDGIHLSPRLLVLHSAITLPID